jgi:hypothetical protein
MIWLKSQSVKLELNSLVTISTSRILQIMISFLSQPYFGPSVESSGTLECLELESKAQKTFHWGVLGVIGKVLKRRYRKWPRIGHLDICNPSYGQKKGRESNWQFDSRPLKVGNRPVLNLRSGGATWRWKALFEGYNFGLDLVPIGGRGEELWSPKVSGLQSGTISRLHFGSPGKKWHSGVGAAESHKVYYRE